MHLLASLLTTQSPLHHFHPHFLCSAFADKWPSQGRIDIIGLSVKYRPEIGYAIKDVTLSIPARAKVCSV